MENEHGYELLDDGDKYSARCNLFVPRNQEPDLEKVEHAFWECMRPAMAGIVADFNGRPNHLTQNKQDFFATQHELHQSDYHIIEARASIRKADLAKKASVAEQCGVVEGVFRCILNCIREQQFPEKDSP